MVTSRWRGFNGLTACLHCAYTGFGPCGDRIEYRAAKAVGSLQVAVSGGWLGAGVYVGTSCGAPPAYFSASISVWIDAWTALRDGVWSGSTVFTLHAHNGPLGAGADGTITVGADASSALDQTKGPFAYLSPGGGICAGPGHVQGTLTIFDDGTFTLA